MPFLQLLIVALLSNFYAKRHCNVLRSFFELFWYTHHLFIVFYMSLMFHGYSGFVKRQTNFGQVGT